MKVSIFYQPPILEALRDVLNPSDYAACSLVCFEWSRIFASYTWRAFVFKYRDYARLLAIPAMERRFLDRARTIREVTIEGSFHLGSLLPFLEKQHQQQQPSPLLLLKNQLTRVLFLEWGPQIVVPQPSWENCQVMEKLVVMNKATIESIEVRLHLLSQLGRWRLYEQMSPELAEMSALTSIILKGPSSLIYLQTLFLLLVNCPGQVQVLKIEHPVDHTYSLRSHVQNWRLPARWRSSLPPEEWNYCNCKARLEEIWSQVTPTRIRVLALPEIMDSEQERPVLLPFLRRRCPKLQFLKFKYLGITSLEHLASTLNRERFPDL
ncbi:hypothetical protein BGX29_010842 [Mortierella sp. GBA35]|nr:hypothetical protein BGX29_010842 [Mortierella sp. GBA35]